MIRRGRAFLWRAWVERAAVARLKSGFPSGPERVISALSDLVVLREGVAALRYDVRRGVRMGREGLDDVCRWDFDLVDEIRAERNGWSFGWYGEQVSSPGGYLAHSRGGVGIRIGCAFLEALLALKPDDRGPRHHGRACRLEPLSAGSPELRAPGRAATARMRPGHPARATRRAIFGRTSGYPRPGTRLITA